MPRRLLKVCDNLVGLAACLILAGVLILGGSAFNAYREIVAQTRRVATNLTLTVERDIGRDFHLVDRSIQGIIAALHLPEIDAVPSQIRHSALFDASMNQEEFGAFMVLNQKGQVTDISGFGSVPQQNFSDRVFFKLHEAYPSLEPLVGPVDLTRSNRDPAISLSRRLPTEDGSFAGLVVGTVYLSFYRLAFDRLDLGSSGSITLVQDDGTVILRDPAMPPDFVFSADMTRTYRRALKEPSGFGTFVGPDGVGRFYAYHRVSDLPMFVIVGFSIREILAPWLQKFGVVTGLTALLCIAALWLTRALDRELKRRRDAEARLVKFNQDLEERVMREIAAREEAQSRLAAGQRLEALGQLAGGVAHDFNNVLQTVASANGLLARQTESRHQRLTQMIADAADRGASVARRLLVFARQSELKLEVVSATFLVRDLKDLLKHTLGSGIEIRVDAEPGLPLVRIDRSQLETVLVNLATNARDAMKDTGGILSIGVRREVRAKGHASGPGDGVCITVSDTGAGMSAAVLARATEPFFTTKPVGSGTGLGLAMASGFAEQSGGSLTISSEVGVGTTISFWLPRCDDEATSTLVQESASVPNEHEATRILLVDDDMIVRELLAEQLKEFGYQVTQACDAASALASAEIVPDIVVTDLSMPGMDGIALIRELHRTHADLPAILVTGYAGETVSLARSGANRGDFVLLEKPLRPSHLVNCISALLRRRRDQPSGSLDDRHVIEGLAPTVT